MRKMDAIRERLVEKARRRYKRIYPCSRSRKFKDCFTRYNRTLYFWFDTKGHNTHVVFEKLL